MKVKGIKRGQTIELLEQIESIPDGIDSLDAVPDFHHKLLPIKINGAQ